MERATRRRRRAAHGLWLAALVVVLAGLFGMHGLGQHGAETESHHLGGSHAGATISVDPAAAVGSHHAPHDDPGMDMTGAAMCLAVLLLALTTLIARISASGAGPSWRTVARPSRSPAVRGREPDPPDLHVLSVQRC